jgi:phage terminase small subunit
MDRAGKPVYVETPDGQVVPAFTFEPMAVLKGAELLGKHLKMFTDKVEHSGTINWVEQLAAMSGAAKR